jgi:hypothetical protein
VLHTAVAIYLKEKSNSVAVPPGRKSNLRISYARQIKYSYGSTRIQDKINGVLVEAE